MAREEKTLGEFLALLKAYDPALVAELRAGAEEVEEETSVKSGDAPAAGDDWTVRAFSCGTGGCFNCWEV